MAATLQTEVLKRFPDSRYTAVGGFIFLRFFCPAISSPEGNNLVKTVSKVHSVTVTSLLTRKGIKKSVSACKQSFANACKWSDVWKERRIFGLYERLHRKEHGKDPTVFGYNCRMPISIVEILICPQTVPNTDYEPLCTLEEARKVELPNLWLYLVKILDKLAERLQKDDQAELMFNLIHVLVRQPLYLC
jgi:hypothetical protein